MSISNAFTQPFHNDFNTEDNLNRYWYYKERLKDFIWMSPNADHSPGNWSAQRSGGLFIHNGSYMPAKRNYIGPPPQKIVQWTDGPEALGYYILLLATEYRLLKDYGQPYTSTLNELSNAMFALERLDMDAEH